MRSIDDLEKNPIEEIMLTARQRIQRNNPRYQLSELDLVMYHARNKAREESPPIIEPRYLQELTLRTVYGN